MNPAWVVAIILMVGSSIGASFFIFGRTSDPFSAMEQLSPRNYLDNANSLRGNLYKLEGVIDNSLAWSPSEGRLYSVQVEENGTTELLPILVPPELNHINIQRGNRMHFKVRVQRAGILVAEEIN